LAVLTINGYATSPNALTVAKMDISKAERNGTGKMIIERIATKTKLSLAYTFLSATDMKNLLNAVAPSYYNVTYIDPVTNTSVTSSFYAGDRSMGYIDFINGVARYKDVSFDLIEL
jgi:hypothetical protein